ncbi:MAG: hypothetical protein Q4G33_07480 [bacterium]|nr:hypothetical protein [bacterium]
MGNDEGKSRIEDEISYKAAEIAPLEIDAAELKKINKYTLSPVAAEEVYTFKVCAGTNELDDRNYEPFNLQALKDMQRLFVGKTVIKDHIRKSDNQIARVYDTELMQGGKLIKETNELHTELWLKCYMVRTEGNKDLISEIKAGIKKEVSTGTLAKHLMCSVCGTDNKAAFCPHLWGHEYDTASGRKRCYFTIDGVKDAYELSFVTIPAQPTAGTRKAAAVKEAAKEEKNRLRELALEADYYANKFMEAEYE